MSWDSSRRAFLKHATGLAVVSGLAPYLRLTAHAASVDKDLDELARELDGKSLGQVLRPGNDEYPENEYYYNARFDCVATRAYIRPASPEGVLKIIEWAGQHQRTFAIRGGGHSFEGKSSHRDVVIDMSRLTNHQLMPDGTLQVEAGVLLDGVYETLGEAERVLPAGTCPSVGLVGHALGGGIGDFLPMFGYTAQSLKAVKLVTFGGSIVEVDDKAIKVVGGAPLPGSELKASDFMTVLRGGGQGLLGVATNMTFETQDLSRAKLASFHLASDDLVSARKAVEIIRAWQDWREALPNPMRSIVSSKVNLSRDGNRYEFEIAGLIAIPEEVNITVAAVRRTLSGLFVNSGLSNARFSNSLSVNGAIETFIDTDETTHNTARDKLYGSSSSLPSSLSKPAVEYLIENLQEKIFVSFYTSGGQSKTGPATSLHASEFLIEWTTYVREHDPDGHRDIRALSTQVMKLAGFEDQGSPKLS